MAMTLLNDVITDFLKFDFVIISSKKQNLATSRNFKSPKSKVNGLGDFFKFVTKIMISAKIQPKNLKQLFDWGAGLPGPL